MRQPVLVLGRDLPERLTLVADMSVQNCKTQNRKLPQTPWLRSDLEISEVGRCEKSEQRNLTRAEKSEN